MTAPVFASAMETYYRAGWTTILPVPPEAKFPPPAGFTGEHGAETPPEQLVRWTGERGGDSVALRMPDGVIGIDVDHYVKGDKVKRGADTLAERESAWGPLPATWGSTARGTDTEAGPSRVLFYRVPAGRYATLLGPDVEVIQHHHRYAVVAPSPHAEVGAPYRWYRPDGTAAAEGEVPRPSDLPELPTEWVAGLCAGATEAGPQAADHASGEGMLAVLLGDDREPCAEIANARGSAEVELTGVETGSRHDTMLARVHRVVMLGAGGHPGAGTVLAELAEIWTRVTEGEARDPEYHSMMLGSARKAVTVVGTAPIGLDPCLLTGGYEPIAGAAPVDDRGEDYTGSALPGPIGEPTPYSWRHVIGTGPFDPQADLDQTLAGEALVRTWPMVRHASDTKSGWLLRGPVQWELHGDLTRRAVAEVASLMPTGDPTPVVAGTPATAEQKQFKRRKRLLTNASANAVAGSMKAMVAGGWHPNAVRLADLDNNPDVLWAGGMPYDLRASADGPAFAQIELDTPHLVSAGVRPDMVQTPAWDAFTATVWPDPEVRAWALRVLSIAVTGYADAALPILLGPGGSGKTSLIELVMSALGSYSHAANVKLLSGEQSHDSIVFALKGRRLSFIDEGPREGRWAQERLKQLTGGGQLTGNAMNQNPITFSPTHTLVLTSNTEPVLTDEAVRRRVRLIPCEADPADVREARAAITPRVWAAEAPGVLAMLMAQAAGWLADPASALTTSAPASIRFRADEIAEEQDHVLRWVTEECADHPPGTPAGDLYEGFVGNCRNLNVHPSRIPSLKTWALRLDELGYATLPDRRAGRRRPLRIRSRGGYDPDPGPVTGVTGCVTGCDGSQVQPVTPHNPSSSPVFAPLVTGVTGSPSMSEDNKEDYSKRVNGGEDSGAGGENPPPVTDRCKNPGGPATMPVSRPVTPDPDPSRPADDLGSGSVSPRSVSATDATRRADQDKITKAEARKRISAERRAAAVAEAAGPVHGLPAAVDRSGTVVPLEATSALAAGHSAIARSGSLTVDVETSGYPVGHPDYVLRSVQLGDDRIAIVWDPVVHADQIRELLAAAPRLHAHSATADLVPLALAELTDAESAWERMHDTVIGAKLADPQSTGSDPGLKQLAGTVLGEHAVIPAAEADRAALFSAGKWLTNTKTDTPPERSGWAQVATGSTTMLRYAASDVLDTAALTRAVPVPDPAVLERERLVQRMTARVTHHGIRIDAGHVAELSETHTAGRAAAGERVHAYGIDNPGSNPQVAKAMAELGADLPRTAKGAPSVAEAALKPLAQGEGPAAALAAAVLDYRHHDTVLGTFLEPYRLLCARGDGRARPTIYTLGTDTGRMSCVRPNLQQLPRAGGVRACLTADPGQLMIGADFSGVELRVAAALSQDPTLLRFLAEGRDLHAEVAGMVFGADAAKAERYRVKPMVFGRLYGGGVETLAGQGGVPVTTAQAVIDALDALTPGLTAWSATVRNAVKRGHTQFPTYAGRTIHLPREYPHKAPNYCIQGTARELLVDTYTRWRDTPWGHCVSLPVHDELDVFVPENQAAEATAELVRCMETELYGVRIVADPSEPAYAWADST